MTQEHPITPPPELVEEWMHEASGQPPGPDARVIATKAARWGADEQLEMDATWVALQISNQMSSKRLIAEMRPKPPSLKAGAIEVLDELDGLFELPAGHYNTILRALEKLDDSL